MYPKDMGTRSRGDPVRRLLRSLHQENVHTTIFTPRTYQVELLDSALKRNTIVCLGTGMGKTFIGAMLIKELAYQVRKPYLEGGKRTLFLVNTVCMVEHQADLIQMHTDLHVGEVTEDITESEKWQQTFIEYQVLVMTGDVFLNGLQNANIPLDHLNLLIVDECHYATQAAHPFAQVMNLLNELLLSQQQPRILGLTTSVLNNQIICPTELEKSIGGLEKAMRSQAETASDMIMVDLFGSKPKEILVECEEYVDKTNLVGELDAMLNSVLIFLDDCNIKFEEKGEKDPCLVPRTVFLECQSVLHTLGPWCAGKVAQTMCRTLVKMEDYETQELPLLFLRLALSKLCCIQHIVEHVYDNKVQNIEEFLDLMSPKVRELIEVLRSYKPDDNFIILGEDEDFVDRGSIESDDDSLNLSGDDTDEDDSDESVDKKESSKNDVQYVAVKRTQSNESRDEEKDEQILCGVVFVERRHTAFVLNKLISELCNWDPDLFFVKSHHITGQCIIKNGNRESETLFKKQEEILRKFRQKELNLLISTSVLEEGVDVPKCNLIVRFDMPNDYRSYVQSKGRARAAVSKYYLLVDHFLIDKYKVDLGVFKGIEKILSSKCNGGVSVEEGQWEDATDQFLPPYCPLATEGAPSVTMTSAIGLVNRYCAKLPSDAFTHLSPKCTIVEVPGGYQGTLQLPINSPIKKPTVGDVMSRLCLAKMAVALRTCQVLHESGELDDNLLPVGKEMIKYEDDENEWEETELQGQARPGTTKRKQYYCKKIADALLGHPAADKPCMLYHFNLRLTCPITEEQNTRGRKIHAPEATPCGFGVVCEKPIPLIPFFPVFTRSGEVTSSIDLITDELILTEEQLDRLYKVHQFVFSRVLRLEKDPMTFQSQKADSSLIVVPTNQDANGLVVIDWTFIEMVENTPMKSKRKYHSETTKEPFAFRKEDFENAVIMPSYRNIDQPQYFYVAEICFDLNPHSQFPSPNLFDTFEQYYSSKYGLEITSLEQPLLDVDHTSARLNLLTPRYMNQKGVALPTSSAETRRSRRENLQQKQILIPELCDIHPFPASLWRKAVCIPTILYRVNYLLIAEELRMLIAKEAGIGMVQTPEGYRFPELEFGFSTKPTDAIQPPQNTSSEKTAERIETSDTVTEDGDTNGHDLTEDLSEITVTDEGDDASKITENQVESQINVINQNESQEGALFPDLKPNPAQEIAVTSQEGSASQTVEMNGPMLGCDKADICDNSDDVQQQGDVFVCSTTENDCEQCEELNVEHGEGVVSDDTTSVPEVGVLHNRWSCGDVHECSCGEGDSAVVCQAHPLQDDIPHKMIVSSVSTPIFKNTADETGDHDTSEGKIDLKDDRQESASPEEFDYPHINFDHEENLQTFIGPSPCVLLQTLTMSNANDFFNLERLETIGDSFLKFAITVYLYCTYPGIHEGKLSYLRSKQVSNYNLYKLGKKKSLPDCMVAAKFEPMENWLPPGYIIKEEGAYKGLSVRIASKLKNKKLPNIDQAKDDEDAEISQDEEGKVSDEENEEVLVNGLSEKDEDDTSGSLTDVTDASDSEDIMEQSVEPLKKHKCEQQKYIKALEEVIQGEEVDGDQGDSPDDIQCLIPYNLQTQHSLPDKSIADCVEALIGCYLTICGQRAALQFMSWLGLKVLPENISTTKSSASQGSSRNICDTLEDFEGTDKFTDCQFSITSQEETSCISSSGDDASLDSTDTDYLDSISSPPPPPNRGGVFGKLQLPASPLLTHVDGAESILEFYLDGYSEFEENICYKFNDRSYLLQAFTHASYHYNVVTDCYQRLEFLGDAILDYVITRHLFEDSTKHSPGVLTDLRSALVNNNIFAALAVKWNFHKYFKAVSPQLFNIIDKFITWQKDKDDNIGLDEECEEMDEDGGNNDVEDIEIPKALGDIFESVAGAIYLDSGMSLDTVWKVYYRMMKPQIDAFTEKIPKSPVRELLEMEPETAKFEKPERTMDGKIRVTVYVVGKGSFRGIGRNYRMAKSAAAKRALKYIKALNQHIEQGTLPINSQASVEFLPQIIMHQH